MICQEDITKFFEDMSWELKQENIPILNLLHTPYPGYKTYEEIAREVDDDSEEENELETS